jgi:FeS assembly SUF system protein
MSFTIPDSHPALEDAVISCLKTIYDPEIPVNIYDLGLIYQVNIDDHSLVRIQMTLTAPNCPVAESLPLDVKNAVKALEGVSDCEVELVFDPPWNPDLLSPAAKLELGLL